MVRAVLYVRVSTDHQEALNQSIALREYCNRAGYEILEEYVDIISGKETSRPAFDRLFHDAHQRKFDMVVFWDLSRFSRAGTLHTLQKLQELQNTGVDWESYQEPAFRSAGPFKDVLISMIATLAKIEREKIAERTKAGLARAKAQGKHLGRRPLSDYLTKRILELHSQGLSINQVSKQVNAGYGSVWRVIQNTPSENQTIEPTKQDNPETSVKG